MFTSFTNGVYLFLYQPCISIYIQACVCIFMASLFFPLQSVCTCSMTTGGEVSPEYVYMQPTVTEQVSVV